MTTLRLFPLNVVVFPGQKIPLHVFEPRYRTLVQEVLQEHGEFGIVLIKKGREAGALATPQDVGCSVRILQVQNMPDGRYNIACEGVRRFRIVEALNESPYLRAEVEFLPPPLDTDKPAAHTAAHELHDLFSTHMQLIVAMQGGWQQHFRMPHAPNTLADHVAGRVSVGAPLKQKILQEPTAVGQLRLLHQILEVENAQLTQQVASRQQQKLSGLGVLN